MSSDCKWRRSVCQSLAIAYQPGHALQHVLHVCTKVNPVGMCLYDRYGCGDDGGMCDEVEVASAIITPNRTLPPGTTFPPSD